MTQKIMTKFKIEVIEYDPSGYYYPKYRTIQIIIAESLQEALEKAIYRTPWKHGFGSGWEKSAEVVTSEDIVIDTSKDDAE